MIFNHGEFPPEQEESVDLENIVEGEIWIWECEPVIELPPVPQDDYLEKELERQREEDLKEMVPNRIP